MAQKTLAELFYVGRTTEFNDAFWNKFLNELTARFTSLEGIKISWDTVVQEGLGVAIDRINEVLGPAAERIQNIASLGFLSVSSSTDRILAPGINNFVVDPGDSRDLFVPTPFVAVTRLSEPLDYAIGVVTYWERATGSMDINIVYIEGDGDTHDDWTISAVAGQALAQAQILGLTTTARDEAVTAKMDAQTARGDAIVAKTDAQTAKADTLTLRDEVRTVIGPAGAAPPATLKGKLWYDTASEVTRVWDGTSWAPVISSTLGGLRFESGTLGAAPDGVITVDGGFSSAMVFVNGALLREDDDYTAASPTVTLLAPIEGDQYFVWGYKALDATDYYTKEQVDAIVAPVIATFAEKGTQPGDVKFSRRTTAPAGWLKANGAAVSRASYPELDAAIYVGDSANATALDGYRCTNPANPTGTRSVSGSYIVLPDLRGEFLRGWDDGRGIDPARALGSAQSGQNLAHDHNGATGAAGASAIYVTGRTTNQSSLTVHPGDFILGVASGDGGGVTIYTGSSANHTHAIAASGGSEARPRNYALLALIKY
ncbi:tail fiber protein [Rhizobium sp. 1AS11]|uniref:tail fiber protein n=1 Tax=Rhizobium acaciae TaxID=2989736 RepID=UPI0022230F51|nr:tail fiber protein [Rhizobium acaciae]MCW1412214.1 tail fiber protein [Rhizobium acaciae]MCW1744229.1 tail fiber protein [Rhizobium acaciae]